MKPGIAKVATTCAALLAMFAGGAAAYVFMTDWSHGDEPRIATVLLLGVFLSVFGGGLAAYSAVRLRYRLAWVIAAVNALVLVANFQGFRLF